MSYTKTGIQALDTLNAANELLKGSYMDIVANESKHSKNSYRGIPVRSKFYDHLKIGRNEKCPCGSGKKYKYCCINKLKE